MEKESRFPLWAKILIFIFFGVFLVILSIITDADFINFADIFPFSGDEKKEKPQKENLDLAEEMLDRSSSDMVDEESSEPVDEESSDTVTD